MLKNNVKQQISIETKYIFQNIQNIMALIKKTNTDYVAENIKGFQIYTDKKKVHSKS